MSNKNIKHNPFVVILGIAQDGGVPQCGCKKVCCKKAWKNLSSRKKVACLAIVDPKTKQRWFIDVTPDFKEQLFMLDKISNWKDVLPIFDGIFLTHSHIGHFTGLVQLEKAILNTRNVLVFVMPKMKKLLSNNRPWKDLVENKNIKLKNLADDVETFLNRRISILPFSVPHRDEHTETVGFVIKGPHRKILFIPDIDKWELLDEKIEKKIKKVDFAFLDGTFFDKKELPNRDISKIPHPLIKKSINRFKQLPLKERKKVSFIHFNHTNPVLNPRSKARKQVTKNGLRIAKEEDIFLI